ncbi:ligand-binding sensor domain-containing protein [Granulicella aggregans]|uniref:Ligand-binding sensor domain-containing protein n=1 Tax=Granulicella aggregans TaxID=474949 RepID=A0A7W7ZD67_9BACT|nr:sensor histidine kinase [Granulicella aggregans]MBB5057583.1 ligand-binding sensor domain-containing protein [Granulicella aggregans]
MMLFLLLWGAARESHALGTGKPLKQYGRQSWQSDSGLPQNTVHAVAQTREGFLWLATEGGLVRFDGQEFRTYDRSNTPELPGDSIEGLSVDGRGVLWVSCAGGLVRLEGGKFGRVAGAAQTARVVKVLRNGDVLIAQEGRLVIGGQAGYQRLAGVSGELVAESADGMLWIASGREVVWAAERTGVVGGRFAVADIGELQAIASGERGEVWVGGHDGFALFRDGTRVSVGPGSVTSILPMPNGEAWIGTDRGLIRYRAGLQERVAASGIASGRVEQLFRDREGSVWVIFEGGVSRIAADGSLQEAIDLPGVLSISEDSEGDMWFGTDAGGATVLREQAFTTLTVQDGLSDDFVRAVFQDHVGRVWIGTNRGGLNEVVGGKITAIRAGKADGLASNVVLALAESGGDLFVGTPDGLNRLHDGRFELFTTANGLPDDFVRSLYTDADGSLWIGTRGGLSHYAHGRFTSYSTLDGLGSNLIGSILRARDGTLWVGTLGGVSRFDGAGFKNFTQRDGMGGDAITTLAEDSVGTIWIAAHGAGLTRLRGGVFTAVSAAKVGLPSEIYSVLEDQSKNLWMGTAKGVYRVPSAGLNAFVEGRAATSGGEAFGVADGMKISECSSGGRPAGWRMQDGSLWFATLKGVASIHPESHFERRNEPVAAIEQVAIDDQLVKDWAEGSSGEALVVPAGRERVTIHYAAPRFRTPQKVIFRYMLVGFDHDWVMAGSRRTAYYTNIPAGTYRFLVSASNGDGAWSESSAAMQIVVKPRFYRTWWFYLLLALLVACATYGVYWLRVRSVEASYQAVMGERNRIAREIHDTLAQGYVGVSLQLEMVGRLLKASRSSAGEAGPIEGLVESTKEMVRSSLEEARSSIWNLRSAQSDAEAETLPARLAAAVRMKQRGSAAAIRLTVRGTFRPLERSVEDEMLRIGQEAVSNAVRHASANAVEVVLKYDTGWLELKVSDDGTGFVRTSAAGHYGLQGIEERAAAIGAKLRIESSPGAGTMVEARLGIAGKKRAEQE